MAGHKGKVLQTVFMKAEKITTAWIVEGRFVKMLSLRMYAAHFTVYKYEVKICGSRRQSQIAQVNLCSPSVTVKA